MTRRLWPLAAVALAIAGCGADAPSGGAIKKTSARDRAVRFAECMRDNGIAGFPDPDASGELTIDGVVNGSSIDPEGAAWKQAIAACLDLQPSGFTGKGKRSDEQQDAALAFAECIRRNGVTDFPDPVNGQPLVDTRRIPSTDAEGGMTILNAAMATCSDQAEAAIGSRP